MVRVRSLLALVMALVLAAALVAVAQAQAPQGSRRGSARGLGRGTLLGLLRLEQVQKELKLNGEQLAKVEKIAEDLTAEMREQYASLREIEDREKRMAKMTELADQLDRKAGEQLRDVLDKEQMTRLHQIRLQVRAVVESLASKDVANQLQLTEEQQKKLAQISKDMQAKQSELYGSMRDASQEQRAEMFQKLGKIRSDADQQALGLLTAEQKEAFEKMQGKKFELQMGRGRR